MAGKGRRKESYAPFPLQGGRLIQRMQNLLERLHLAGTERDRAGNRRLFCDQYLSLLLLISSTLPSRACALCNRRPTGRRPGRKWESAGLRWDL